MKTIRDVVALSVEYVLSKGGRPRREVEEWIAHILGMRRLDVYLQFDRPLEDKELNAIRPGIGRLASGEPLAYVQGFSHFYDCEFIVTPAVLIPRPETELVVEAVKGVLSSRPRGTIVDVGTGSGCIGLTLKRLFPGWHVIVSDISEEALRVTRANAERLAVEVEVVQGDLLEPFIGKQLDCVVANPPYLSSREFVALDPSVAAFEPRQALEAGPLGTECYQRLFAQLENCLAPHGCGAVEIGSTQGEAVMAMARSVGDAALVKDFAGFDRIVTFSRVK
jgi:release factor glutamine methyltransferase